MPDSLVFDRIIEVWHKVKKHAIIAVVFDKSGSMRGPKMNAALAGAEEFIRRMDPEDFVIWIPFDAEVYRGKEGLISGIGESLVDEISGTTAGGGTALYDAVLQAFRKLESQRLVEGDTIRYGLVLLSDGRDE